jgi:hypothetical protein
VETVECLICRELQPQEKARFERLAKPALQVQFMAARGVMIDRKMLLRHRNGCGRRVNLKGVRLESAEQRRAWRQMTERSRQIVQFIARARLVATWQIADLFYDAPASVTRDRRAREELSKLELGGWIVGCQVPVWGTMWTRGRGMQYEWPKWFAGQEMNREHYALEGEEILSYNISHDGQMPAMLARLRVQMRAFSEGVIMDDGVTEGSLRQRRLEREKLIQDQIDQGLLEPGGWQVVDPQTARTAPDQDELDGRRHRGAGHAPPVEMEHHLRGEKAHLDHVVSKVKTPVRSRWIAENHGPKMGEDSAPSRWKRPYTWSLSLINFHALRGLGMSYQDPQKMAMRMLIPDAIICLKMRSHRTRQLGRLDPDPKRVRELAKYIDDSKGQVKKHLLSHPPAPLILPEAGALVPMIFEYDNATKQPGAVAAQLIAYEYLARQGSFAQRWPEFPEGYQPPVFMVFSDPEQMRLSMKRARSIIRSRERSRARLLRPVEERCAIYVTTQDKFSHRLFDEAIFTSLWDGSEGEKKHFLDALLEANRQYLKAPLPADHEMVMNRHAAVLKASRANLTDSSRQRSGI